MRKTFQKLSGAVALAAMLTLPAFGADKDGTTGWGEEGHYAVVDEFARVAAGARINHYFAQTAADQAPQNFKMKLVDQIARPAEGPTAQAGRVRARGLGVTSADFTALVEDLRRARQIQGGRRKGRAAGSAGSDEVGHRHQTVLDLPWWQT
jgi:hypothetical protein